MSKIAVMMSADRAGSPISAHFGKAEWVMVSDLARPLPEFVRNEMLNGKSALEIAIRNGCTDVIFTEIGNGAYGHLTAAGLHGWVAPRDIAGQRAIQMFESSTLQPANGATKQGGGLGCHCSGS